MRITMFGAGYVGLVTGACFSEFGWTVTCVDKVADKIDRLRRGEAADRPAGRKADLGSRTRRYHPTAVRRKC